MQKHLVPVTHRLQLRADSSPEAARAAVYAFAAKRRGELVKVQPDLASDTAAPGMVTLLATIAEPAPEPPKPVPWVRIIGALTGLVLAVLLLVAAIIDLSLLVGALILTGLFFLGYANDQRSRDGR